MAGLLFVDSRLNPGHYRRIQFRELLQSSETIRTQRLRLLVYDVLIVQAVGRDVVAVLIDFRCPIVAISIKQVLSVTSFWLHKGIIYICRLKGQLDDNISIAHVSIC